MITPSGWGRELQTGADGGFEIALPWRGTSDTETLLECFRLWGPACLERLNGMFAFAIWDTVERRLFLARDRMGVKPMYYAVLDDGQLLFFSTLELIRCWIFLGVHTVKCQVGYPDPNSFINVRGMIICSHILNAMLHHDRFELLYYVFYF